MIRVFLDDIIDRANPGGGIARYFAEIVSHVAQNCSDIEFLVPRPGMFRGRFDGCERIRSLGEWPPLRPRRFWRHVESYRLKRFAASASIFTSTYYMPNPWPRQKSVAVVYDFIDAMIPSMSPNGRPFIMQQKRVIEAADAVVAISESTKRGISEFTSVPPERVTVIYPGASSAPREQLDTQVAEKCLRSLGCVKPYWLFVGNRERYKNFTCLLEAFVSVAAHTDSHLVVVGGARNLDPSEISLIIKRRLESRVHVLGRLPDDALAAVYAGAAAFIYSSIAEGFGIPLLEAMQAGAPVIASDIPVFHEVAADAALFFDPHSADALADVMLKCLQPETRNALIRRGNDRAKAFSWDAAARRFADVYRALA